LSIESVTGFVLKKRLATADDNTRRKVCPSSIFPIFGMTATP
jgi:hypothetical protein